MAAAKITREYHGETMTLVTHMNGQRALSMDFPDRGVKWAIRFAELPATTKLIQGDTVALLSRASQLGRPLTKDESMAALLARRLLPTG